MCLQVNLTKDTCQQLKVKSEPSTELTWQKFDINNIVLPSVYSKRVQDAIDNGMLGDKDFRLAFIRESVSYFESRLPNPTPQEYAAISKKFCDKYTILRSSQRTKYWVIPVAV